MRTRVKICCIASTEEAKLAIEAGADAVGLVGRMPSGPGPISDELIRKISSTIPPPVTAFLLTSETTAEGIIRHCMSTYTGAVQIVDDPEPGAYIKIRQALPAIKIVQVIHVSGKYSVEKAIRISSAVDALLLDSGNPGLTVKELGGTGRVHDWSLSKVICSESLCPVFLAGGLNPSNVALAISTARPYAVDVCSGIRTDGKLDREKLRAFMKAVASAP